MFSVFVRITLLFVITNVFQELLASCPADQNEAWSYDNNLDNGPNYWQETYPMCAGQQQSPINIDKSSATTDNLKPLDLKNYDKPVMQARITNNGHTVQFSPDDGVDRFIIVNGKEFYLQQFHFHWGDSRSRGSEHTLDGKRFPMEVHFVHMDDEGTLAVVGAFLQETLFRNPKLNGLEEAVSQVPYRNDEDILKNPINLLDLIDNHCSFYRYAGSLTTPPCSEGVIWSICMSPKNIGYRQIQQFRKLYSAEEDSATNNCKISNNYRPLQPLNGRGIYASKIYGCRSLI